MKGAANKQADQDHRGALTLPVAGDVETSATAACRGWRGGGGGEERGGDNMCRRIQDTCSHKKEGMN